MRDSVSRESDTWSNYNTFQSFKIFNATVFYSKFQYSYSL